MTRQRRIKERATAAAVPVMGLVALVALAVAGCGGGGKTVYANGSISGIVMTTRPVANAAVKIWQVDDTGQPIGTTPVATATTDGKGAFSADIGTAYGAILIEARGGHSEELVSGAKFDLDMTERLAVVLPDVKPNAKLDGVMITPLTTMAEALGNARLACKGSDIAGGCPTSYADAQTEAAKLIGGHFGNVDPVLTQPKDPTAEMGATPTDPVRYGLVLAGFSELSGEIASDSGVDQSVLNTMTVTDALVQDLSSDEARFDGKGPKGQLAVGSCPASSTPTQCDIGDRTVRGQLANAMDAFVGSNANVTGLSASDISQITLAIAQDDNPKLFSSGPGQSAPIAFDPSAFYLDMSATPNIWWTNTTGPLISGTVNPMAGQQVMVTVTVGSQSFPATVMNNSTWQVQLPDATLQPSPASNMVTATSEDAAGNKATAAHEFRVDTTPATVAFLQTTVRDELSDTVTLDQVPPIHDHSGDPLVTLADGSGGCPIVRKHATLMDSTSMDPVPNPIHFKFQVTDTDSGVLESSIQYRIRDEQSGDWLTAWTAPTAREITDIPGGYEADVTLYRDTNFPALATFTGKLDFAVRATDHLGQGPDGANPQTTCWDNRPLGGPLLANNAQERTTLDAGNADNLSDHKLENNNLANLIDGKPSNGGAAVIGFDVTNYNTDPVYFDVSAVTPTSASGSKTWVQDDVITSVRDLSNNPLDCSGSNLSNCDHQFPFPPSGSVTDNVSISPLISGTRVRDDTNTQVSPCCGKADRYLIPAASPGNPVTYHVQLLTTDLSPLFPGQSDTGNYVEFSLGGKQMTGRELGTGVACTKRSVDLNTGHATCVEQTVYEGYIALTDVSLSFAPVAGKVSTSSTDTGPSYELNSLVQKRPSVTQPGPWTTHDDTPPTPPSP